MKTLQRLFVLVAIAFGSLSAATATEVLVTSPDENYRMSIRDDNGQLTYTLSYKGRSIVSPSVLGIQANSEWLKELSIANCRTGEQDETWRPVYGERSQVRDHYRSWEITLNKKESKERLIIDVRAYNEGVAFRYRFVSGQYLKITKEYTEFAMPEKTMAYYTERAQTPYHSLPLQEWPGESDRPLLLKLTDGTYVCLAEAQVVDYVRTKFALSPEKPNTLLTAMYGPVEDIAPYATPWRVIMAGNTAGEILEHNDILLNLNPPCALQDTDWIKPGKTMREVTLTTEGGLATIDFAVKHKLSYILFDAGWYGSEFDKASDATTVTLDPKRNPNPDALDLQKVIRYGKEKGIGVFVYVNQRALQQQLDEILPLYKSWGVAGIKFGFVQVGSNRWTAWMHEAVKKCAQYGLLVDIHDEYRPTGFSRTYPNLMTQEGIRGNEEFPDATHHTILPFTRFVAGAADYTICYYRQDFGRLEQADDAHGVPRSKSIQTTPAHQLALAAIFYSPMQVLYWYDKPSDSRDEPELKFFDDVPTVWDDTKVLQGEPGQCVAMARRSGGDWFAGLITNNDARRMNCSLDFLEPGQTYRAEIYTDGGKDIPTRTKVKVSAFRVDARMSLTFNLRASGGVAIRFIPEGSTKNKQLKAYKKQVL